MKNNLTSVTELQSWLADLPRNTQKRPYTAVLDVKYLGGDVNAPGSVGSVLAATKTKYVNLDLSAGTIAGITDNAFSGCTSLTGIIIPATVTGIGEEAFSGCSNLASVSLPTRLDYIGYLAFDRCTSLTAITIPSGVTVMRDFAFEGCTSLASIIVDPANAAYSSVDGAAYDKAQTTITHYPIGKAGPFVIPSSVTHIGAGAFFGCAGLTGITIPDSVTHIGEGAFSRCRNLTSITIPASVTHIAEKAFNHCENLNSVTFNGTITQANFTRSAFTDNLYIRFYSKNPACGTPGTYDGIQGQTFDFI